MKLTCLTMHNFMPFRGEQRIVFPSDPNRNVMMVFGNNMYGKTSILNSLRWCFYGIAMGRHLRQIPLHQLHNIDAGLAGDWLMEVAIQFETSDGHSYELRRKATKKRLVATPERPEDFDVQVFLLRDHAPVSGHLIEHEINKFAPEQVSRFFLFDGELLQEYETLLIEGDDQGRRIKDAIEQCLKYLEYSMHGAVSGRRIKDAIEQCLGVPALIHGREDAMVLRKKSQKQQNTDLTHLRGAERYVERQRDFQVKGEAFEKDLRELKEKLKNTKDERTSLEDDIEKNDSIYQAKITIDEREKRQNQIVKDQETLQTEKLDLISKAWRELLRPKLQIRRDQLIGEQQRLTGEIEQRSAIETEIRQLKKVLDISICPTCGQDVAEVWRKEVWGRLGVLESELREMSVDKDSLANVSAEIAKLNRIITKGLGERIRDKDRQITRLEVELTLVENEIEALKEEIKGNDPAEIMRKRAIRDALMKEEGKIESSITDSQKKLDNVNQELALISRQLDNLPQARAARSSSLVGLYTSLEKIFSESIARLRDNLRSSVESYASTAFRAMITQQAYSGLEINNNYGLTILDEKKRPVPVRSSGAEQIVALSLIDGLARSGRAAGPVVMDTPFGRLDLKHRDNILRYLPTTASQLVLLVHDGEIRKDLDLAPIASRIGVAYNIVQKGPRHSTIERSLE